VWTPPVDHDEASFETALLALGVRPWQAAIVAPMLAAAFAPEGDDSSTSDASDAG
jgi:ribonuclease D